MLFSLLYLFIEIYDSAIKLWFESIPPINRHIYNIVDHRSRIIFDLSCLNCDTYSDYPCLFGAKLFIQRKIFYSAWNCCSMIHLFARVRWHFFLTIKTITKFKYRPAHNQNNSTEQICWQFGKCQTICSVQYCRCHLCANTIATQFHNISSDVEIFNSILDYSQQIVFFSAAVDACHCTILVQFTTNNHFTSVM